MSSQPQALSPLPSVSPVPSPAPVPSPSREPDRPSAPPVPRSAGSSGAAPSRTASPRRSPSEVEQARRAALEQFQVSRDEPIDVGPGHGAAREARMELDRREAVRERERAALRARAAVQQEPSGPGAGRPRAVVVHRVPWLREALCRELERAGVAVVEMHEDGAAGLGTVVAEQPDLVVVQEQLPWKDGLQVVREVRRFAPAARIAVHLDRPAAEQVAREAGADAVFPRATRPVDMVPQLVQLVGV